MTSRARLVTAACGVVAALYLIKGIYRGLSYTHGDFYNTLPGEYASRLNPTLWHSADMQKALEYNHGTYLYGPTQYLTLFPIVFLDSYASIASWLLAIYPVVLLAAVYGLWRLLAFGEPRQPVMLGAIGAVAFAFLPLLQTLIQREFEVVAFLLLVATCLLLARGREAASGAMLAYLAWFKYWPALLLGAFVVHRRVRGLAAFAVTSAVILLTAQLAFGLQHFMIRKTAGTIFGLVRPLGGGEVLYPVIQRGAQKSDFCRQWIEGRGTQVDVRWALCGVEDRIPAISAKAIFYALAIAAGAVFVWGAYRLETAPPDAAAAKWGTIWEISTLAIVGVSFVHAHYYYYVVFLLPLSALLYWYATRPQPWRRTKIALWIAAYVLLNAFIVPASWLSAVFRVNVWPLYVDSGFCLLGTIVLLALVLWELLHAARQAPRALAIV
jgi:hypothetical protein